MLTASAWMDNFLRMGSVQCGLPTNVKWDTITQEQLKEFLEEASKFTGVRTPENYTAIAGGVLTGDLAATAWFATFLKKAPQFGVSFSEPNQWEAIANELAGGGVVIKKYTPLTLPAGTDLAGAIIETGPLPVVYIMQQTVGMLFHNIINTFGASVQITMAIKVGTADYGVFSHQRLGTTSEYVQAFQFGILPATIRSIIWTTMYNHSTQLWVGNFVSSPIASIELPKTTPLVVTNNSFYDSDDILMDTLRPYLNAVTFIIKE